MSTSVTHPVDHEHDHARAAIEFPPTYVSDGEGAAFLGRLALIGAVAGVLAGLASLQLAWWVALILLAVWLVGALASGCVAAISAKKHRAGVGYPADPDAWLSTFARAFTISGAVVAVLAVGLTFLLAFLMPSEVPAATGSAGASTQVVNYTPPILVAIVSALAVYGMRWISTSAIVWLMFGRR